MGWNPWLHHLATSWLESRGLPLHASSSDDVLSDRVRCADQTRLPRITLPLSHVKEGIRTPAISNTVSA